MEKNFKFKQTFYKKKSLKLRKDFFRLILDGCKFHIGGTLSCLDILTVLFYEEIINFHNKKNIFILSKGHALGAFFAILLDKKIISKKKFLNLNSLNKLGNQLDVFNLKHVDWSTGSLGHALGVAIGLAIANPKKKMWVIVGDGEMDEGSIWEAILFISKKKIKNINLIIDKNNISASSYMEDQNWYKKKLLKKLDINYFEIDGHDFKKLTKLLNKIKNQTKSSILLANTIKGKGVKFFENNIKYNHNLPDKKVLEKSLKLLERN